MPAETSWPPAIEQWRGIVEAYFPASLVEDALAVIDCETGHTGDPNSYNPSSGASGLFQFIPDSWASASVSAGWGGADVFDPEANVAVAAWLVQDSIDRGIGPWWHWSCKP